MDKKQQLNILVVEDGQSQRKMLRDFLRENGHDVSEAEHGLRALDLLSRNYFDLLIIDYKMPGMDGMELLREVKGINPEIDVIMMTAYGTVETAVQAMKAGAADYITKPIELDELLILIDRISERRTLLKENEILRDELGRKGVTAEDIIFRSPSMNEVINLAGRVAESRATVLIQGESGTGKELIARLIHALSPRSERPMTIVNCAALPENLLESELFGHEKGAFTGASQRRIGRFEEADGGRLFLDEIGELSQTVQVKLLRFLQDGEFQRIGDNQSRRSNVRVISATNQDLSVRIREGAFREDLYYRLNVVAITIPPLRARKDDIAPLMDHFRDRFSKQNGKDIEGFLPEARDLLLKYDYPGNVRELENIIERAVVIARGSLVSTKDLPFAEANLRSGTERGKSRANLKDAVEALECEMIRKAMDQTRNHQTHAADILGISERTLRYKLKKYGLKS
ncbi:MAG: sigma-54-dependent Fis family transcriptional regulator [Deltaproteobacteria bacterium]|nr:sigma-54-dependent Fis family transcriptional regulator [Deltaproteobacteria bacterium]